MLYKRNITTINPQYMLFILMLSAITSTSTFGKFLIRFAEIFQMLRHRIRVTKHRKSGIFPVPLIADNHCELFFLKTACNL
jgi:hypothetical protein